MMSLDILYAPTGPWRPLFASAMMASFHSFIHPSKGFIAVALA